MYKMFKFLISVFKRRSQYRKYNIVKNAYKKPFSPFLRFNDTITDAWYVFDEYEKNMNLFIDHYVSKGFNNFFIDIGANIGLTTLLNSNKFQKIFCFEPNELVFNVLKTNVSLSKDSSKIHLFNVGLGLEKGEFKLRIPYNNFGGAFIEHNNSYDQKTIFQKESFDDENPENFLETIVKVENDDFLLNQVMHKIKDESKGIIKIDVEGYELNVLELIVKNLTTKNVIIIFENWQKIEKKHLEKILKTNNELSSFSIKYIKWLDSWYDKLKYKSIYSPILSAENEIFLPQRSDIIIELKD